jgi:hypothetical protein
LGYAPDELDLFECEYELRMAEHFNTVYAACVTLLGIRQGKRSALFNSVPRDLFLYLVQQHVWPHRIKKR